MHANDTSLCHRSNDISKLATAMNDLQQLQKWLKGSKITECSNDTFIIMLTFIKPR